MSLLPAALFATIISEIVNRLPGVCSGWKAHISAR